MTKIYLLFFTILLFLLSCSKNRPVEYAVSLAELGNSTLSSTLSVTDTIVIETDSITSPRHYYGQATRIEGKDFYIIFNEANHSLQLYNLFSDDPVKILPLASEGPDAIPEGSFFYYHNQDSIFFINHHLQTLFIASSDGKVVHKEQLNYYNRGRVSTNEMFLKFEYNPVRQSVYFWLYANPPAYSWTKGFYYLAQVGEQNLAQDTTIFFGQYPPVFHKSDDIYYPNEYFNGHITGSNYLMYFYPSHEIQLYDLESKKLISRIKAKSRYIDSDIPPYMQNGEDTPGIDKEFKYLTENPFYVKLLSSKDGSRHYRIVKHGVPFLYPDGRKRHYHDIPFSVMVLDRDFKLITEEKFEGGKFDFFQSFVLGDRLFLSLNNLLNKDTDDEHFRFAVLEVK